jgi:D-tyrosyl-tRNA(Tyr) deacylase
MRAVLQRVSSAQVSVDGQEVGRIGRGLVVLVGIGRSDGLSDVDYIVAKIRDLRVFEDHDGKMNRSLSEVGGAALVVSQFTLYGDCRRGRRPSFDAAAAPDVARGLYDELATRLEAGGVSVQTGRFQAMMEVELVNDGPVTLLLDSTKGF